MISPFIRRCGAPARKGSLLLLALVGLLSFLAVGCGDSSDDFVYSGNNNSTTPVAGTGNVTFRFVQAQQAATVPTATTRLRFEFFNAQGLSAGSPVTLDYAESVTVQNVPVAATNAVVTALDSRGDALGTLRFTFTVLANQTVVAVPAGATPPTGPALATLTLTPATANLNVGQTVQLTASPRLDDGTAASGGTAFFLSSDSAVANVTSTGMVTAVGDGTTTINASYSLGNVTRTALATIVVNSDEGGGGGNETVNGTLSVLPSDLTLNTGATQSVSVFYAPGNMTSSINVSEVAAGVSSNTSVATYVDGVVSAGNISGTAVITLSYLGQDDTANATTTLTVNVVRNALPLQLSRYQLDIGNQIGLEGQENVAGLSQPGQFTASVDGVFVTDQVSVSFSNFSSPSVTAANFFGQPDGGGAFGNCLLYGTNPMVGSPAPVGTTATATVSYRNEGVTYAADIAVTVTNSPSFLGAELLGVSNGSVVIPANSAYRLGFRIVESYSNGQVNRLFTGLEENGYEFTSSDTNVATVYGGNNGDYEGANLAAQIIPAPGAVDGNATATISVSRQGEPLTSFDVTIVDEQVAGLSVQPEQLSLTRNQKGSYSVIAALTGGLAQNVTYALRESGEDPDDLFYPLLVLVSENLTESAAGLISADGDGQANVSLSGPGILGGNVSATLNVNYTGP